MKKVTERITVDCPYDLTCIGNPQEILLFDIETTGLKKETTQVYLIGCGYKDGEEWVITQWLAENALDEMEVLESFFTFAENFRYFISFNGEGFDIPYLNFKSSYYGMGFSFDNYESIDILKKIRKARKLLRLSHMNQKAMEAFIGIERDDEMNGGILIPHYYEYELTGDYEEERLLLLHNHDDVLGMIPLISLLGYYDIVSGNFNLNKVSEVLEYISIEFSLKNSLPTPIFIDTEFFTVNAYDDIFEINLKIYEGEARLYFSDFENYYYLPDEDRVIHKDVAVYVDRAHRKKATKKNCFLRKRGRFLFQNQCTFSPEYKTEDTKKCESFYDIEQIYAAGENDLKAYALNLICCL